MKILRQLWRGLSDDRQADGEGAALVGAPAGGSETAVVRPRELLSYPGIAFGERALLIWPISARTASRAGR
jgi:hypothetical protein